MFVLQKKNLLWYACCIFKSFFLIHTKKQYGMWYCFQSLNSDWKQYHIPLMVVCTDLLESNTVT